MPLGSQMGGDDEQGLIAPVARVVWFVELALEVDGLADSEMKRGAAPEEDVVVRGGAPGPAAICEDGQRDDADAVVIENPVVSR